jgi:hypothetical protein
VPAGLFSSAPPLLDPGLFRRQNVIGFQWFSVRPLSLLSMAKLNIAKTALAPC